MALDFSNCYLRYQMDEMSGNLLDTYGNHNGAASGSMSYGNAGVLGTAICLSGANGSIHTTPITQLGDATTFTLEFCGNFNSFDSEVKILFFRYYSGSYIGIYTQSNNLGINITDGDLTQTGIATIALNSIFTVGQFKHVVFSYNAGSIKLFINGVEKTFDAITGTVPTALPHALASNAGLTFLGYDLTFEFPPTNLILDEFCLYSDAKDVAWALTKYNALFSQTTIKGYLPITIKASKVAESNDHFPWLFDLSRITDNNFWSNITSAGDIIVVDQNNNVLPRIIDNLNTISKSGSVLFDAIVSSATDKIYNLYVIPSYNAINDSKALTNSNCLIRHSFDGSTSPLIDSCGNYNATNNGSTLNQTGQINKSVLIGNTDQNTYLSASTITQMNSATNWTSTILIKPNVNLTTLQVIFVETGSYFLDVAIQDNILYCYFGVGNNAQIDNINNFITLNQWNKITISYDGSGTGNAGKVKIIINGVDIEITSFTGTIPTNLLSTGGFTNGFTSLSWMGYEDEMRHYTDTKSVNYDLTEYNMIFDSSSVSIGSFVKTNKEIIINATLISNGESVDVLMTEGNGAEEYLTYIDSSNRLILSKTFTDFDNHILGTSATII